MELIEYKNIYWQNNPQYFIELIDLINKFPKKYIRKLKANGRKRELNKVLPLYKHLYLWIKNITIQYDSQIKDLKTRVYWILNGLTESPRCINEKCNKLLIDKTFDIMRKSQPCYCSMHCVNTSILHSNNANKTKHKRAKDDINFWKKVEQKKKQHKIKNGHSPNWNNSQKNFETRKIHATENPNFYYDIQQKRRQTNIKNGHHPNWHNEEQMIKTRYEKNNGVWESEEIIRKKEATSMKKYGFKSPNSSQIVKQHKKEGCLKKFGVDHYSKTSMYHKQMCAVNEQRKEKEYLTKKKNKSFNISKAEDRTYKFLISIFNENDIERQYKSIKYPFNCDFYIKSKNLYIECNYSWTHGGHWFDETNEKDLEILQKWKNKRTKYYLNAIKVWTNTDLKKKNTAKENNLNYIVLWKEDNNKLLLMLQKFL